jgi:uncharacterized protein YjiS (DUF1127 family)
MIMAHAHTHAGYDARSPRGHSAGRQLAGLAVGLWDAYLARRRRQQAIAALHALSDRALSDIGVSRSEIEARVLEASQAARVCAC